METNTCMSDRPRGSPAGSPSSNRPVQPEPSYPRAPTCLPVRRRPVLLATGDRLRDVGSGAVRAASAHPGMAAGEQRRVLQRQASAAPTASRSPRRPTIRASFCRRSAIDEVYVGQGRRDPWSCRPWCRAVMLTGLGPPSCQAALDTDSGTTSFTRFVRRRCTSAAHLAGLGRGGHWRIRCARLDPALGPVRLVRCRWLAPYPPARPRGSRGSTAHRDHRRCRARGRTRRSVMSARSRPPGTARPLGASATCEIHRERRGAMASG
jgi:hypothetical protein